MVKMIDESVRPWGNYEILRDGEYCKVKIINVKPGARLSYQYHHQRDENWTVVLGIARVTLDGKDFDLKPGEHIYIKRGQKHRVSNPGTSLLRFIEVQTGEYFGEDDIVRIEDDYNRV